MGILPVLILLRQLWLGSTETRAENAINCTSSPQLEQRASSLASPEPWLTDLFGGAATEAGISISPTTALRCAPVRAAVGVISETIGVLPLPLYRKDASGARSPAEDHPVYEILNGQANEWTSASVFREQITRDALLWGNGYAKIVRDGTGQPRELIRLRPEQVAILADTNTGEPAYKWQGQSIPRQDILHLKAPSVDGIVGASPVMQCREAIALNLSIERHVNALFAKGAKPSGVLKSPVALDAKVAARLQKSWAATYSGSNSGGTAFLEEGVDFQPLTLSSIDSDSLNLWRESVNQIARTFRVPPTLIFELQRATWGNATELSSNFLKFTLSRWLRAWEDEIRLKLLSPAEKRTLVAEFDTDELLRADLNKRAEAYQRLVSSRIVTPNECRNWESLRPLPGGDELINPNTMPAPPYPSDDQKPPESDDDADLGSSRFKPVTQEAL